MGVLYWILAFLIFSLLIFIHEMGHYLTARLCGVTIEEFSIGMGPKMLTYTSRKTGIKYSLGIFLFGGYVSMAGEDEESDDPNAFSRKAAWKRFLITASGALMNLLFGFLLVLILVLSSGPLGSNRIAAYPEEAPYDISSADSGLQAGDELLSINGKRVHIAADLSYEILHEGGNGAVPVTIRRDGQEMTLSVIFPAVEVSGIQYGQADFYVQADARNVGSILYHTFYRSCSTVKMIWDSLIDLVRGQYGFEAVSGPIGVADAMSEAAEAGFLQLLYLTAVISINLGVFNLLPLPALDGGRLVFLLIEMIGRHPVPVRYEGLVHFVGLMLMLGLMVVITFKDLFTLFT